MAKNAIDAVALSATTGLPQTWLIEMHPTFGSIEDLDRTIGGPFANGVDSQPQEDLVTPPRAMVAILRPALSYRPDEAIRAFPKARYVRVTIHRVRQGMENDFSELVRLRKLSHDSINLDRPDMAYQVISGALSTTYVILSPLTTLRVMDEAEPDPPAYAQPIAEARAKAAQGAADIEVAREQLLFRVEPQMSNVSNDFAAGDRDFWRRGPGGQ